MDRWQAVKMFRAIKDASVDNDGRLMDYVGPWPAGTMVEDIWKYIEEECPGVSIAQWLGIAD